MGCESTAGKTTCKQTVRFYQSEPGLVGSHDAILHLLNRRVGDDYLPVEPFEATIDDWNGIPLIFAARHIEFSCSFPAHKDKNLQTYLEGVSGVIVGELSDSRIEQAGRPKLMTKFNFGEGTAKRLFEEGLIDEKTYKASVAAIPIAQKLVDEGKLSLSSAFCAPDDGNGSIAGTVRPNHVLLFEESAQNQPKDRGSVILNQMEQSMKKLEHEGKVISSANRAKLKQAIDALLNVFKEMGGGGEEEKQEKVPAKSREEDDENANKKKATAEPVPDTKAENEKEESSMTTPEVPATPDPKDAEIEELKRQNQEMQAKIAAFEQAARDAAWEQIKSKLPPGMVHGEKEQETRALFESDHVAFTNKLLDLKTAKPTSEEGEQHANQGEGTDDTLAIVREMREASGRR